MKLFVCIAWFATCCGGTIAQQSHLLEFSENTGTVIYDLSTAQIIQPGRFAIISKNIDSPDVMRFRLRVLDTLRNYCARGDGKYPAPTDLFTLGPPDMPIKEIEVHSDVIRVAGAIDPSKIVSWPYPYQRLQPYYGTFRCKIINRTEAGLYSEARNEIMNGVTTVTVFDCKRGLWSLPLDQNDDPAKATMMSVERETLGFRHYLSICRAVTYEAPHIPE
jgi:hypothetical protein